jgi:primosomal protein N' (replication factor Y)
MTEEHYSVAEVVFGLPLDGPFDYFIPEALRPRIAKGDRVDVLFNRKRRVGFVTGFKKKSLFPKLNPIQKILDNIPVMTEKNLRLAQMMSEYYGSSVGEAIEVSLPASLRRGSPQVELKPLASYALGQKNEVILFQEMDVDKRFVFIKEQVENVLKLNQSILWIVPETFLIKVVANKLSKFFPGVVIIPDEGRTPKEELNTWLQTRRADVSIVVGTRSTIFAPANNLGLIIVEDEDHPAYVQEQAPHYHLREVACMRSTVEPCRLIFLSLIPSPEVWHRAQKEGWTQIQAPLATTNRLQMVDMTNYNPQKSSILSFPLQNVLEKILKNNGRVILLMNKRGFSSFTRCNQCGHTLVCERCGVSLTYLYSKKTMVCRHCNFTMELPKICPKCSGAYLRSSGAGIEKLESELSRLYPYAKTMHFDRDSVEIPSSAQIIIATQAILRFKDTLKVEAVAILNFDAELNHVDFRSGFNAFALLAYLRLMAKDLFLIQTRASDSYVLKTIQTMDMDKFYKEELKLRRQLEFPPYQYFVSLTLRGVNEEKVLEQIHILFQKFMDNKVKGIEILEPQPDQMPKLRDQYRHVIRLRGKSNAKMLAWAKPLVQQALRRSQVLLSISVDP